MLKGDACSELAGHFPACLLYFLHILIILFCETLHIICQARKWCGTKVNGRVNVCRACCSQRGPPHSGLCLVCCWGAVAFSSIPSALPCLLSVSCENVCVCVCLLWEGRVFCFSNFFSVMFLTVLKHFVLHFS